MFSCGKTNQKFKQNSNNPKMAEYKKLANTASSCYTKHCLKHFFVFIFVLVLSWCVYDFVNETNIDVIRIVVAIVFLKRFEKKFLVYSSTIL